MKLNRKYHYDEHDGVFVFEDEISINWLLSQVLNADLQITKISNEQLQTFLGLLGKSNLRMPNGQYSLFWLREQIKEKLEMSDAKLGEVWHQITTRYRYVLECIDFALCGVKDIHEKMDNKIEPQKIMSREPNNMQAYFEPI